MNRNDLILFGLGGAGNKLLDDIVNTDPRFIPFFINASLSDIQTLNNYDDVDVNYFSLSSQNNGTGRSREIGKRLASKNGYNILDIIQRYPQKTITFISSFGGGSGSSILSIVLKAISKLKKDGDFDKIINVIGILPRLNSVDLILENTVDCWNEVMSYDCVNNMIIVDNNNIIDGEYLDETIINQSFAESFNAIFDIPNINGTNFDSGNLSRIINSKGCTYFYNLPNECDTTIEALEQAEKKSILGKMYKSKEIIVTDNGLERIQCGYVGASFNNDKYSIDEVLYLYKPTEDIFSGYNEDSNILLISGALPPLNSIKLIQKELYERKKNKSSNTNDFSKFIVDTDKKPHQNLNQNNTHSNSQNKVKDKGKIMKKTLKKNLFDTF